MASLLSKRRTNQQITGKIGVAAPDFVGGGQPPQGRSIRSAEGGHRGVPSSSNHLGAGPSAMSGLSPDAFGSSQQPSHGRRARTVEVGDRRDVSKQQEYQEEIRRQMEEQRERKRLLKEQQKAEDEAFEARIRREQELVTQREQEDIKREQRQKEDADEAMMGGKRRKPPRQQQQEPPAAVNDNYGGGGGGGPSGPTHGRRAKTDESGDPRAEQEDARRRLEDHQAELARQIEEKKRRKAEEAAKQKAEDEAYEARMEKWAASDAPLGQGVSKQQQQQQQQEPNPSFLENPDRAQQPPPMQQQQQGGPGYMQQQPAPLGGGGGGMMNDNGQLPWDVPGSPHRGGPPQGQPMMMGAPSSQYPYAQPNYPPQPAPFSQPYMAPPGPNANAATADMSFLRDEIMTLLLDQRRQITELTQMQQYGGPLQQQQHHAPPIPMPGDEMVQPPPSYRNFPATGAPVSNTAYAEGVGAGGVSPGALLPASHTQQTQQQDALLERFLHEDEDHDTRRSHSSFNPSSQHLMSSAMGGTTTEYVGIGAGANATESTMELSEEPTEFVQLPPVKL